MTPEDTETIRQIVREEMLQTLLAVLQGKAAAEADERPGDLVDAHYVAERLGLRSHRSVLQGKGGAINIPRARSRPARRLRRDVDAYVESLGGKEAPAQRAMKLLERKAGLGHRTLSRGSNR